MNIVWDQHSAYDGCEFTKADLRAVAWGKTLDSGEETQGMRPGNWETTRETGK